MESARNLFRAAAWLVATAALGGCLPDDPPASQGARFEVVGLPVDGLAEVPRNQPIQVVFNGDVDPTSVNDESVRILLPPEYRFPVPARFDARGRAVTLLYGDDMPTGLRPSTVYEIVVPGFPQFHTVRSVRNRRVAHGFRGTFRTSDRFALDTEPPHVTGSREPRSIRDPAEVSVGFSEAIDPRSLVPERLVLRNELGDRIRGRFFPSPNLRRVRFVPEHDDVPGSVLSLSVRGEITDLAGNFLAASALLTFYLDRDAEIAAQGVVDLTDPLLTRRGTGMELSPSGIRPSIDALSRLPDDLDRVGVEPPGGALWTDTEPRRVQLLYTPEDVGGAGEIHRLYFETLARPERSAFFDYVEIRLWHTDRADLGEEFQANEPEDPREVLLVRIPFLEVPGGRDVFPFFTVALRKPFVYDGERNLVVEVTHFGGTADVTAAGLERPDRLCRLSGRPDDPYGRPDRVLDDIRFGLVRPDRWVEVRPFADSGATEESFRRAPHALVDGNVPYLGDFVLVEYEGTDQAAPDGEPISPTTGFVRKPALLSDRRFIRCRLHLLRDVVGGHVLELRRLRFTR